MAHYLLILSALVLVAGCDRLNEHAMTTEQISAAIEECEKAELIPAWFLRFKFEGPEPTNPIVGYQCQPKRVELTVSSVNGEPTADGLGWFWRAGPEFRGGR